THMRPRPNLRARTYHRRRMHAGREAPHRMKHLQRPRKCKVGVRNPQRRHRKIRRRGFHQQCRGLGRLGLVAVLHIRQEAHLMRPGLLQASHTCDLQPLYGSQILPWRRGERSAQFLGEHCQLHAAIVAKPKLLKPVQTTSRFGLLWRRSKRLTSSRFERARLQPCRNGAKKKGASAPEVCLPLYANSSRLTPQTASAAALPSQSSEPSPPSAESTPTPQPTQSPTAAQTAAAYCRACPAASQRSPPNPPAHPAASG